MAPHFFSLRQTATRSALWVAGSRKRSKSQVNFLFARISDISILLSYIYNNMKSLSRILLISNSTVYGRAYLDHVAEDIENFLGRTKTVMFFPFALYDRDSDAAKVKARFEAMGYSMESVHSTENPLAAIQRTDAIFVGGGNTFRLLKALQDLDLLEPIRRRVKSGTCYIGSSAGSNVAGPTIRTTKDMPIVQPRSFD